MANSTETDDPGSTKRAPELAAELRELVVGYARQETVAPLRRLGRFIGFGIAGSALMGIGLLLLALAAVRALQSETMPHLSGNWSWAPYLVTVAGTLLVAGLLATRITAARRRAARRAHRRARP